MADVSTSAPSEKTELRAEAEDKPESAKFWLGELEAAGKRDRPWIERARKVVERYRDERRDANGTEKRANILWSNTEILKSALFQRLGNPDVRRRFPKRGKDEKNTKQAALVMERGASYSNEAYDCETQVEACVEDMILPGRGVAWVVYDADVRANEETGQEEIARQTVKDEHVFWEDYRCSAGRKDSDVWWKARRHYYSRDELRDYFPKHADKVKLNAQLTGSNSDGNGDDDTFKRAAVWEIWDKSKRQRIYIAEDYPLILKKDDDPYRLVEFFPCPEPLYGVKTTSSLEPIPEFTLYQDQANELDVIATRLCLLIEALKRRGVYDAGLEGADGQLSQLAMAGDNVFLPFKGMAGLMEKGGLKQVFQSEDLAPIVTAIEGLYKRAASLIQTIYEVTGISDVIRGAEAAGETATEVRIKGQFGSMRLQKRQRRVQRFIRDLTRIKTEIIAEHFTREQLQEMVGLDMPLLAEKQAAQQQLQAFEQQAKMAAQMQQQAQMAQQAPPGAQGSQPPGLMGHNGGPPMMGAGGPPMGMQPPPPPDPEKIKELQEIIKLPAWEDISAILRSDQRRGYKVDVETDQTAQVDEQEEKNSRIEFLTTITSLIEKAIPMAMQLPAMRPLIRESVQFAVKAFKAGRPLEEAFEEAFEQLAKMPPPQNQGDPLAEAQAEKVKTETKLLVDKHQQDKQTAQIDLAATQQSTQADVALKTLDVQAKQQDMQIKAQSAEADMMAKARDVAMKARESQIKLHRELEAAETDRAMADANRDLAEITNKVQAADAVEGFKAKRREEQMSVAERQQKMRLAERKSNQPTQSGA